MIMNLSIKRWFVHTDDKKPVSVSKHKVHVTTAPRRKPWITRREPGPMRTRGWKLPMKVIYKIIGFVEHDMASQRTLSLVCRDFKAAAQRRLFSHLSVPIGQLSFRPRACMISSYFDFFYDNPHLVEFVTSLRIHGIHPEARISLDFNMNFAALVESLPNLKHLSLERLTIEPPYKAQFKVPSGLRSLHTLKLHHVTDSDSASEHMFTIFPIRDAFEFSHCSLPLVQAPRKQKSLAAHHLKIRTYLDAFPSFSPQVVFSKLDSMSVELAGVTEKPRGRDWPISGRSHGRMDHFVVTHGRRLVRLALNVRDISIAADIDMKDKLWSIYHLNMYTPYLRTLQLTFRLSLVSTYCLMPRDLHSCRQTIEFLRRIIVSAPPTLNTLILAVDLTVSYSEGDAIACGWIDTRGVDPDWRIFQESLGARWFAKLERVLITGYTAQASFAARGCLKPLEPRVQRMLGMSLSILRHRGLLRFE